MATALENDHEIFIFTGTTGHDYSFFEGRKKIFRINANGTDEFRKSVLLCFSAQHSQYGFDVIEAADYGSDAYIVKKHYPSIPYIIRLHTPSYLVKLYGNYYQQYILPKKYVTWCKQYLKKYCTDFFLHRKKKMQDIEYANFLLADYITSPSLALAKRIKNDWKVRSEITVVPNPYFANSQLLEIPLEYNNGRILFIGKLSVLKGLVDIEKIISITLKKYPFLKFRFIGNDSYSPNPNESMKMYIIRRNARWESNLEFTGFVPNDQLHLHFAASDIVICPSLWENFPNVILESMSAGRIVVATKVGGIPEIISHKKSGLLVRSKRPNEIFRAITWIYNHRTKLPEIGKVARAEVINRFGNNSQTILKIEKFYTSVK